MVGPAALLSGDGPGNYHLKARASQRQFGSGRRHPQRGAKHGVRRRQLSEPRPIGVERAMRSQQLWGAQVTCNLQQLPVIDSHLQQSLRCQAGVQSLPARIIPQHALQHVPVPKVAKAPDGGHAFALRQGAELSDGCVAGCRVPEREVECQFQAAHTIGRCHSRVTAKQFTRSGAVPGDIEFVLEHVFVEHGHGRVERQCVPESRVSRPKRDQQLVAGVIVDLAQEVPRVRLVGIARHGALRQRTGGQYIMGAAHLGLQREPHQHPLALGQPVREPHGLPECALPCEQAVLGLADPDLGQSKSVVANRKCRVRDHGLAVLGHCLCVVPLAKQALTIQERFQGWQGEGCDPAEIDLGTREPALPRGRQHLDCDLVHQRKKAVGWAVHTEAGERGHTAYRVDAYRNSEIALERHYRSEHCVSRAGFARHRERRSQVCRTATSDPAGPESQNSPAVYAAKALDAVEVGRQHVHHSFPPDLMLLASHFERKHRDAWRGRGNCGGRHRPG